MTNLPLRRLLDAATFVSALLAGCSVSPSEAPGGGYIDVHSHLQGRYRQGGAWTEDYPRAAAEAVETMDRLGAVKMLLMPPPQPPGFPRPRRYSRLRDVARGNAARFAFLGGGGTLNPMIHESAANGTVTPEMERRFDAAAAQILDDGGRGFGEMTALHLSFRPGHPFLAVAPDHPLFRRLADLAARYDVPIDIHMEAVVRDMAPPPRFSVPPNAPLLRENISAFERLLAHDRGARIVWAHIGWDNTGHQTTALLRRLLAAHANLFLHLKTGLRPPPGGARSPGAANRPLDDGGRLRREWLALFVDFPDRFMMASDHFYGIRGLTRHVGRGGGTNRILKALPPDLARKIGIDNAVAVYRLDR